MDNVNDFFATLSSYLWGWPMIVLLLGTHVFLTIRLHFPQRKLFTAIAAFGIGCTVQANAISTIMHASYGISTEVCGGVLMLLAAAVIIGGVRSISKVCSMLVPFMALLYVLGCIYILYVNVYNIYILYECI